MTEYKRFGLYVVPEGPLFAAGSAWLGWNSATGRGEPQPVVPGLVAQADALTRTPRKYGFHGTLKPPFRLADGMDQAALVAAVRAFCATRRPVVIPALTLRRLGGFVAITPEHPSENLNDLACATVATLDPFRAAPSDAELSRRRKSGLSTRQDALLRTWGYPYVMDEFRFHMTLTGRCDNPDTVRDALDAHFAPVLPAPFVIDSLCLMGEAQDGLFHLIHRYRFSQKNPARAEVTPASARGHSGTGMAALPVHWPWVLRGNGNPFQDRAADPALGLFVEIGEAVLRHKTLGEDLRWNGCFGALAVSLAWWR